MKENVNKIISNKIYSKTQNYNQSFGLFQILEFLKTLFIKGYVHLTFSMSEKLIV